MADMVTPVFGSAGSMLSKGIDLDEVFSDCYFAFGGADDIPSQTDIAAGPGESSNESAGETLDVEGFSGANTTFGGGLSAGLGLAAIPGAAQPSAGAGGGASAGGAGVAASARGSRAIGIGLGVAAGAATVHRGMKRELSDSNISGAVGGAGGG
ncbi:unnamed protein product, partial [Laminaria digitata]